MTLRAKTREGELVLDLIHDTQDAGNAAAIAALTDFDSTLQSAPGTNPEFLEMVLKDRIDSQFLSQYIARLVMVQALAEDVPPKDVVRQLLEDLEKEGHDPTARFNPATVPLPVSLRP